MLNITENSIRHISDHLELDSMEAVQPKSGKIAARIILGMFSLATMIFLFLPWTQNVNGTGRVTALKPSQRPQALHSALAGRIEEWFVKEGDFVKKGDTLLFISEIKEDYFDPQLLPRTQSRIEAKGFAVDSYRDKVQALNRRITTLTTARELKSEQAANKIEQAKLKITSDSIDVEAARVSYDIAAQQYLRMEGLFQQGLKSKTDLEARKMKMQEAQAKLISAENKLLTSKNELLNHRVELVSVGNEYDEKIAKANAEKFETLSGQFDAEAEVTKLQSAYSNYSVRRDMYYVRAPQSGYITKTLKTGIGETIAQGEEILTIMPSAYDLAVEIYIPPRDLPLMQLGTEVRLVFDGWPAMVFSGWPGVSSGTFGGKVIAIDNFASKGGKFRMLVVPGDVDGRWPVALRVGSGAKGIALLRDVPVWYEIWRQLNGFPPEYYETNDDENEGKGKTNQLKIK